MSSLEAQLWKHYANACGCLTTDAVILPLDSARLCFPVPVIDSHMNTA